MADGSLSPKVCLMEKIYLDEQTNFLTDGHTIDLTSPPH